MLRDTMMIRRLRSVESIDQPTGNDGITRAESFAGGQNEFERKVMSKRANSRQKIRMMESNSRSLHTFKWIS